MAEPRWLDVYAGQSIEALLAMDGVFRTDSIVLAIEQAIQAKGARIGPDALTWPERVVLAVEALEREVNSGGFDSWLRYAAPQVPDTARAVADIGESDVVELVASAIATLAIDGHLTAGSVEDAMARDDEARDVRLEALDTAYFDRAGDLAEPLLAYIGAHREGIRLP